MELEIKNISLSFWKLDFRGLLKFFWRLLIKILRKSLCKGKFISQTRQLGFVCFKALVSFFLLFEFFQKKSIWGLNLTNLFAIYRFLTLRRKKDVLSCNSSEQKVFIILTDCFEISLSIDLLMHDLIEIWWIMRTWSSFWNVWNFHVSISSKFIKQAFRFAK